MIASYTAMQASPAWAAPIGDTEGVGDGTGTGSGFPANQSLDEVTIPNGIVLSPGQQSLVSAKLFNEDGDEVLSLPDTTFEWEVVSGSGISIVGSNTNRSVTIQGNSAGSAELAVTVEQGKTQLDDTRWILRVTTIAVQVPGPTPTPITPPTNPGPVPPSIPNSDGVLAPEGDLLINPDGKQTGSNPETQTLKDKPGVYIQKGSVRNFFGVTVVIVDTEDLPGAPTAFTLGSSAADITFYDANGNALDSMRLEKAAKVCLPVSPEDLAAAGGGFTGLRVLRYNASTNQWVTLTTTYNYLTQQACAQTVQFSTFALGLAQQGVPTQTPGTPPPATGGWSPTAGLLVFAGLVGVVLVGSGAVTMRRVRQGAREE